MLQAFKEYIKRVHKTTKAFIADIMRRLRDDAIVEKIMGTTGRGNVEVLSDIDMAFIPDMEVDIIGVYMIPSMLRSAGTL